VDNLLQHYLIENKFETSNNLVKKIKIKEKSDEIDGILKNIDDLLEEKLQEINLLHEEVHQQIFNSFYQRYKMT